MCSLKDPRESVTIWLPGIATHFWTTKTIPGVHTTPFKYKRSACGTSVPSADRRTEDPTAVTCRRCLRSKAWRKAWQKASDLDGA